MEETKKYWINDKEYEKCKKESKAVQEAFNALATPIKSLRCIDCDLVTEVERLKSLNSALESSYYNAEMNLSLMVEEVEKMKQELAQHIKWNEEHTKRIVELSDKNKQLKEVLKKCSPFHIVGSHTSDIICCFCNSVAKHKEDCEYIKLIGE